MIIDVNTAYGPWPFWQHGMESIGALAAHLRAHEIEAALVSPIAAPFSSDLDPLNEQLFLDCQLHPGLHPVPVLSPALAGWERRLREALASDACAIKLHPSHHLYPLSDRPVQGLAERLEEAGIPLLVTLRMEDIRGQYRGLNMADLPTQAVLDLHGAHPHLKLVCLNATQPEILQMAKVSGDNLHFDIAFAETGATLDGLLLHVAANRLLLGSQTPLLYTKAALLKARGCTAPAEQRLAICSGNARRLFRLSGRL
jgi:predicted TIM-barrel fold metal-dependent hydrolase